jgi:hypothetical protein
MNRQSGRKSQDARSFGNGLSSIRANDVDAQDPVRFSLGEELDEAFRVVDRLGSRVGNVRKLADLVLDVGLFQLFFRLANPCDLYEASA